MDDRQLMDDNFWEKRTTEVSDNILLEIAENRLNYPAYFIEVANIEIEKRKIKKTIKLNSAVLQREKVGLIKWMNSNVTHSFLILITSILSGFIGFGIVWVSVYISIQVDSNYQSEIWKKLNWVIVALVVACIIFGYLMSV